MLLLPHPILSRAGAPLWQIQVGVTTAPQHLGAATRHINLLKLSHFKIIAAFSPQL